MARSTVPARPVRASLLRAAALGALVAGGFATVADAGGAKRRRTVPPPASSASEQKLEQLEQTVDALERRLDDETKARQASDAQAEADRADARAARQQLAAQIQTIPGVVDTAVADHAPRVEAGDGAIRYKGLTLTLGGFAELAGIYRSRDDSSDISSNFSRIPFANTPVSHAQEFRGSARQSRVSLLAQGDVDPTTHVAFYGEFDFQAAAQTSNSVESNSYVPRIRHLYGSVDWDTLGLEVLAGQTWSLVTLNSHGVTPRNETPPPLIDGQYLPGFVWARQPQLRLVKNWNQQVWVAVSIESPQTTFSTPATGISSTADGVTALVSSGGVSGFDSANNLSLNHVPDVIGKVAFEPPLNGGFSLHLEAFGIWRSFYERINVAAVNGLGLPAGVSNAEASGGGGGGSVAATIVPKYVDVQASVMAGTGIGRYGSAQLPDVTLQPDGRIAPIEETMFLVGGTIHATPKLDLYVFDGQEQEGVQAFDAGGQHFGFGNPAATFTGASCSTEGGICTPNIRTIDQITGGFWDKPYTGRFGQLRVGVQYSHTELTAFRGADGYVPKTSEDMVFTSFRYFPF